LRKTHAEDISVWGGARAGAAEGSSVDKPQRPGRRSMDARLVRQARTTSVRAGFDVGLKDASEQLGPFDAVALGGDSPVVGALVPRGAVHLGLFSPARLRPCNGVR